jgi:multiple sugar transport system permease protein
MANGLVRRNPLATWAIYAGLGVGLVFSGFPILWMFFSSLKSNTEIFSLPPRLLPKVFTLVAYDSIFSDPVKIRFFINSYLVASGFSRYEFRLKKAFNLLVISTQTVPPITLLIPYFGMVVFFGIFNTYLALILTYMVFTLPYAILLMTGYLNTLPKELDEAVLVDGGSSWTALWRVIVPVSIPGIVATAVYTFLLAWNEFLFALTLTKSTELRTVPIGISLLMGQHAFEWNEMMAMSVLGSLPLLLLYLVAQRYFLAGMTAGSVKS